MLFLHKIIRCTQEENEKRRRLKCLSAEFVENSISTLKQDLNLVLVNKNKLSVEHINKLKTDLYLLDSRYTTFISYLKKYQNIVNKYPNSLRYQENKDRIETLLQKKKQYRKEFENIYNNFKRLTKGRNVPERNEILGLMRKAFDFDSSKYYQKTF